MPGFAASFILDIVNGIPFIITNRHVIDRNYNEHTLNLYRKTDLTYSLIKKQMAINKATSSATTFEMQTSVTTNINAPANKIMRLLTDAKNFINWNSTVLSVDGTIKQGETIKLVSKLDPKRTFKLKVIEQTPTILVWRDGFAPLFSGVRTFTLTPNQNGTTGFSMVEIFKGIMFPLIKSSLPDFKENFEQYASDLKKAAENN